MIKISIIVPAYNQEETILMALDSIPKRNDIEIIIIDDKSTDNTLNIIRSYNRIPLKIIENEKNLGEGFTRNIGFNNATGEYLFGLDGDDWFLPIEFNSFIDNFLYKTNYDIIRVPNIANYSEIYNTEGECCAFHTMFIKRKFLGNLRCEINYPCDKILNNKLKQMNPKTIIYPFYFYHYNYPNKKGLT